MTYTLRYHPAVLKFVQSLSAEDKTEIESLLQAIAEAPELGERVPAVLYREVRGKTVYRRKTVQVDKARWPKGLRIVYAVDNAIITIFVVDIGDHQNSVRNPGKSVYPDER